MSGCTKRGNLLSHSLKGIAPLTFVRSVGLCLLLALAVALSACSGTSTTERVVLQLNGPHSVEWAGFYVAQMEGYYGDVDLDVVILPGDATSPAEAVSSGQADFGIMSGMDLLLAHARSQPFVGVFAVMRRSPLSVMALTEDGIVKPRDLRSKRVGVVSSDMRANEDVQFLALMDQVSVTVDAFEIVPVGSIGIEPLVAQRVDAIAYARSTREALEARESGYDFALSYFSEYGIQEYPEIIFVDDVMLEQRSDLVARFVHATLAGYQYALIDPERAVELTREYDPNLNQEELLATWEAMMPFVDTGDALVGTMEDEVWQSTQDILLGQGMLTSPVALVDLYTNQFITWSD